MNLNQLFGCTVKEIRKEKGLSQELLAEKAELSRAYVSRLERGVCNPRLDTIFKISNALSCKASYFIGCMEKQLK